MGKKPEVLALVDFEVNNRDESTITAAEAERRAAVAAAELVDALKERNVQALAEYPELFEQAFEPDYARLRADLTIEMGKLLAKHYVITPEDQSSSPSEDVKQTLLQRSRDETVDLEERIAAARKLGELGDPRLKRIKGSDGVCLVPGFVRIEGGRYRIGSDDGSGRRCIAVTTNSGNSKRPRRTL